MGGGVLRVGTAILAATGLSCANHIRYVEFEAKKLDAEVIEVRYHVDNPPKLLSSHTLRLSYEREERIETRTTLTLTKVEEFTPYSAPRELYEVPLGVASIPLALVVNVLGVVLPGVVSSTVVTRYTSWTFAAANPMLNVESKVRAERREISVETQTADARETVVRKALSDWPIAIRYDDRTRVELRTDPGGKLEFHVLEIPTASLEAPPRKLQASVLPGGEPGEPLDIMLYVDRSLGQRVMRAGPLLDVVNSQTVSSSRLSSAVYRLDQLGFKEYSLRLEDEIYRRFAANGAFLQRFRGALAKLYKGEIEPDPLTTPSTEGESGVGAPQD